MTKLKREFGQRLKTLREQAGLTQDQLAECLECDVSTVSKMERGIHGPRFPILECLARALNAHPKAFFEFPWVD